MPEESATATIQDSGTAVNETGAAPETTQTLLTAPEGTTTTEATPQTDNKDVKADAGAPEKYEFALPDGMSLDPASLVKFETLARERGMTQEHAQGLVDLYTSVQREQVAKHQEQWSKQVNDWAAEVSSDKEIGGANLDANIALAKGALSKLAPPEFRALLESTGLGNNPAMIKFCVAAGKLVAEDKFRTGGQVAPAKPTYEIMFPTTPTTPQQ